MTTKAELIAWLKNPDSIRTVLVEVSDVKVYSGGSWTSTTIYLSNRTFTSSTTDTPQSQFYDPCISGGVSFSESISLDGGISISYGDIEVSNYDGSKDAWLNYVWVNKSIKVYIGDPRWNRADFYQVFDGLVADISSRDRASLNLILVDKLQRLNNPISEETITNANSGEIVIPVLFGECFNTTPIAADAANLVYQVHTGQINDVLEVRDNGVPVLFTKSLATGKFTLTRSPFGQITCTAQGSAPGGVYTSKIAGTIKNIVKNYGPSTTRFVDSEIDLTNFSNFDTANPQPVGVYCQARENMLEVCNNLAKSVNAQLYVDMLGKLKLTKLTLTGLTPAYTITPEDIRERSLAISDKPKVVATAKIGYSKNWTVQQSNGLAGAVNAASVQLFGNEYLYVYGTVNATVKSLYNLTDEPPAQDTLLSVKSDAEAEANARTTLFSTPRYVYTMNCFAHMLPIELGEAVTLSGHNRFGLTTGSTGMVISINRDWLSGTVALGVLV